MAAVIKRKPLSRPELSAFCEQMALILKSGISAVEGVNILLEDAEDAGEKALLAQMQENMMETGSFSEALEAANVFPEYMLHMAQIGEETGTLDEVMDALSVHYAREDAVSKNIRNAVTYPLIMAGVMVVVIVVLLVQVMPIFNRVFIQLGTEMTGLARGLMNIGSALNNNSLIFILIIAAIAALILYGVLTKPGRAFFRKLGYAFRPFRAVLEETAACRFASGMALTLKSGLNPERSMELVTALNEDPYFRPKLDKCRELTDSGEDFSHALFTSGVLKGMYARMASIGAKTGAMDQVMEHIADLYQEDIDRRISHTLSILEPTLVIVLSLIVGAILLSVMLPLMGILSGI